ncbi:MULTISPECIES: serine/threonine protein kinase [unclassified Mycobacterium]|uniref:serine/threonine protein kinase n=1 Tax=unclassified Mycobacterium TaxID=2642494 RepID=UPI0007FD08BF|nr:MULTISPECIES: serine/threonine protein kinase [unclassified Mycobacterium]OBH00706.1 serine/threonine protein kinase [Mycobacterium sp. E2699]OBI50585.1 serine/threonine protein kinase [Mycobacterium sp. E787]
MSPLSKALRAATALALMGGSALVGAATATADPGTGSSADINTLAGALSKGYGLNNCQAAPLSGPLLAELDCGQNPDSNGPAAGVYQLFSNGSDLAAAFTSGINGVSLSACGDNGQSPGTWHQGSSGATAGQVACGTYKNAAVITWTTDAKNVLSHVRASNTDVNALYQWWRTNG